MPVGVPTHAHGQASTPRVRLRKNSPFRRRTRHPKICADAACLTRGKQFVHSRPLRELRMSEGHLVEPTQLDTVGPVIFANLIKPDWQAT